ncbi:putative leader peptide [Candidatus Frankia alpina]
MRGDACLTSDATLHLRIVSGNKFLVARRHVDLRRSASALCR